MCGCDEVRIARDVGNELDDPRPGGAGDHALVEPKPVPHLVVPALGHQPEPLAIDEVHARKELSTSVLDERGQRGVHCTPLAAHRVEHRPGALDRGSEHALGNGVGRLRRRPGDGCGGENRALRPRCVSDRACLGGRLEEEIENERIELRASPGRHQLQRFLDVVGVAVGPAARQCVEDVRNRGDPALERYLLACDALGVAGPVVSLVMGKRDRGGEIEEMRGRPREDRVPDRRVPLDQTPLLRIQSGRLQQDAVRDRDLADVVEAAGDADQVAVLVVESQPLGEHEAVAAHALGVPAGLDVAKLDRRCEAADHLLSGNSKLALRAAQLGDRLVEILLRPRPLAQLLLERRVDPRVVERERRKTSETIEHGEVRLAEGIRPSHVGEPEHAHHLAARSERHADDRTDVEAVEVRRAMLPRPVALDHERGAAVQDHPADTLAPFQPVSAPGREDARTVVRAQPGAALLDEVQVPVRRPQERPGAIGDRRQQGVQLEPLGEADGGLVQSFELDVAPPKLLERRVDRFDGGIL